MFAFLLVRMFLLSVLMCRGMWLLSVANIISFDVFLHHWASGITRGASARGSVNALLYIRAGASWLKMLYLTILLLRHG